MRVTRRRFLENAGAATAAAMLGRAAAGAAGRERPNILWLSCEDFSPHLGCYGDPHALSPTLDALAARGARYTRAFTTAPVCAPNRSCVITGVQAATLGTHMMRSAGEGAKSGGKPALPPDIRPLPILLRDAGYYCTNNEKEDYNFAKPEGMWDESSGGAHWRNRPDAAQPFFAVFNFLGTHEGQVRGGEAARAALTAGLSDAQRPDPASLTLPPYHPETPAVRRQWANYYEGVAALDRWAAERLAEIDEAGLADDTIVVFWSDHGMGLPRGKRWPYDSGTRIPLIVYAPPAWQERLGLTPGAIDDRIVSSPDFAATALHLAGVPVPAWMQGQAFCGPAPATPRAYAHTARDRMDERYDCMRAVRDARFRYVRHYMPWKPWGQHNEYAEASPILQELRRMQRAGTLPEACRWIDAPRKPPEELFDLEADPHELHNLAGDPAHAETLSRLRDAQWAWMRDSKDLGLLPEPELARLEARHGYRACIWDGVERDAPGFWEALHRLALRAGQPSPEDAAALAAALDSPHAAMRWWAVAGLAQLGGDVPGVLDALQRAAAGGAPEVRVAAAQALAARGIGVAAAVDLLIAELGSGDLWVRLHAAIALDELGATAAAARPALERATKDRESKYVARVARHALDAASL